MTTVPYFLALAVTCAGSACRQVAYRQRTMPPRRFSPREAGWWMPPLPAPGEFATPAAARLEVAGRAITLGAAVGLLALASLDR